MLRLESDLAWAVVCFEGSQDADYNSLKHFDVEINEIDQKKNENPVF